MTDIGLTIHPHPTLSETINFAAEMFEGTITDRKEGEPVRAPQGGVQASPKGPLAS